LLSCFGQPSSRCSRSHSRSPSGTRAGRVSGSHIRRSTLRGVPGERDPRSDRLAERVRGQRGRRCRDDVVAEVHRITGMRPTLDDFLSAEAPDRVATRYLSASGAPVQRQSWTTDLTEAVRASLIAAAEELRGRHEDRPPTSRATRPTGGRAAHATRHVAQCALDVGAQRWASRP
jgi:hypothetical protein